MAQYCYKCGAEIRQVNEARRCECCGAHIYGQPDNLGAGTYASSFFYGGVAGLVGNTAKNIAYSSGTKSNKQIEKDYYESDYYRFTQEPLEKVFTDKGMIGEYALEGWIKQTQLESRVEDINGPFAILYNLMVPEPDGSFQEIDMVIITEYVLFVVEIKNRSGKLELEHWSDKKCFIGGEETYSPIIQNDAHCLALRHYLKKCDYNVVGDMSIYNLVVVQPFMDFSVRYDEDEYDTFVLQSSAWISRFHYVTSDINVIIENRKEYCVNTMGHCVPANMNELYSMLKRCCDSTNDRSLEMRFRDEYNENSLKHPWKYYKTRINGWEKNLIRENGVYEQVYTGWWSFRDDLLDPIEDDNYFDSEVTSAKELITLKREIDAWADEYFSVNPEDLVMDEFNKTEEKNRNLNNVVAGVNTNNTDNMSVGMNNANIDNNFVQNDYNFINPDEEKKKRKKKEMRFVYITLGIGAIVAIVLISGILACSKAKETKDMERIKALEEQRLEWEQQEEKRLEEEKQNKEKKEAEKQQKLEQEKQNLLPKTAGVIGLNESASKEEIKARLEELTRKSRPNTDRVVAIAGPSNNGDFIYCLTAEGDKYYEFTFYQINLGNPMIQGFKKETFESWYNPIIYFE